MDASGELATHIEGPWSHRLVSANGTRFHVAEAGEGPLILMLHGFPGSKTSFESTSPAGKPKDTQTYHWNNVYFAQRGYAVINYTARGFGRSCGGCS